MEVDSILGGKYRLLSLIGRGGMGSVWKAEHLGLRALIAVKLMDESLAAMPEAVGRFLREAQAAASLRSPHVVQILDHGVDERTAIPFIAMELMDGESLAGRLERERPLSPPETGRIIGQVARALARAHEAGIIHRDLKPDNIFLVKNEDDEIAKVLDFGIAKSLAHSLGGHSATQTGSVLGTPYYMSPEQISGSKEIDFRTDLWALAVIAYECLSGRRPFEADTVGGLALEICMRRPPPASKFARVPQGFDAWFERATARDAAQRFATARELADELKRVCGMAASTKSLGDAVPGALRTESLADGLNAVSHTAPWHVDVKARRRWPFWLAAGVTSVVAGFVVVWLKSTTGPSAVRVEPSADVTAALKALPFDRAGPASATTTAAAAADLAPGAAGYPAPPLPSTDSSRKLTEPTPRTEATRRGQRAPSPPSVKANAEPAPVESAKAAPSASRAQRSAPTSDSTHEIGGVLDDRK
ncbi:MAG TPA: protein kinase [Polyangiaceae bacterium]|jgi:serine/threonine-protein kinase|nr:protein kinase [Polyangiaceae bacterium]